MSGPLRIQYPEARYHVMNRGRRAGDFRGVGAADKAAIQLVKVQPYQLLVSDT